MCHRKYQSKRSWGHHLLRLILLNGTVLSAKIDSIVNVEGVYYLIPLHQYFLQGSLGSCEIFSDIATSTHVRPISKHLHDMHCSPIHHKH